MVNIEQIKEIIKKIELKNIGETEENKFYLGKNSGEFKEENFYRYDEKIINKEEEYDISLWFLDGSIYPIFKTQGINLQKVRLAAINYPKNRIIIREGYIYESGDNVVVFGEISSFDIKDKKDDYLSFIENCFVEELSNLGDIVIKDGNLINMKKNERVIGLSKDTSIRLGNNLAITSLKRYDGMWIYKEALDINELKIGLIKLSNRGRIYRIDYFSFETLKRVFPILIKTRDTIFGYPIPLIKAHVLSLINEKEAEKDREVIKSIAPEWDLISDIHNYFDGFSF